jgi:hypothetical protein
LETSAYTWAVEWCALDSHPIGQVSVVAPARTFTPPPVDVEIDARLGDVATLVGVNLQPSIALIWRAETEMDISYRVFLHLIGPDGALIAQSDGIPAGWRRPTTGWAPGEYVVDEHALVVPPDTPAGEYQLVAGMYVPGGERLTTPDGDDMIPLTTWTVEGE